MLVEIVINEKIVDELECTIHRKRGRKPKHIQQQQQKQEESESSIEDNRNSSSESIETDEPKKLTKRQMSYFKVGQPQQHQEMNLKRPRKTKKNTMNYEDQMLKKQELEVKRRQQMQQMIEQQKRDTVDKILNEGSRKRNGQANDLNNQNDDFQNNSNKNVKLKKKKGIKKVLEGEVWKYRNDRDGISISMEQGVPGIVFEKSGVIDQVDRRVWICIGCESGQGKYKFRGFKQRVCSLQCYKKVKAQLIY